MLRGMPVPLARLVEMLTGLPGIGPKTAMRLGTSLLRKDPVEVERLASALAELHHKMGYCSRCGCFAEHGHCENCDNPRRDSGMVCVVEQPVDMLMLERGGHYPGTYHVLHGRLSPVDGIGPEQLRLAALDARVDAGNIRELILATSATVDGEATAHYIAGRYAGRGVNVSRIARGIPEGGELEHVDEYTLSRAISQRVVWQKP